MAAGAEELSAWPWIYNPPEWDSREVKEAHQKIVADGDLAELDFSEVYSAKISKFIYATNEQFEPSVKDATAQDAIKVKFASNPDNSVIRLPKLVADIAPRAKVIVPEHDQRGCAVDPIPGIDIRYACIAPHQHLPGLTTVMLSLWIKPPPGYKSQEQKDEDEMYSHYDIVQYTRNEEWHICNLYFGMDTPKNALMLVNAVSRMVFECNGRLPDRVNAIRIMLTGYLEVTECTIRQRDKIDLERLEADPSDEEDIYDEEITEEDLEGGVKLATDSVRDPVTGVMGLPKTPTEKTLQPRRYYLILDEEQFGLYRHPYCEGPFQDLRFYQNDTPMSISVMYVDKRTGQLEIQKGEIEVKPQKRINEDREARRRKAEEDEVEFVDVPEVEENTVFIVKADNEEPEVFKKIKEFIKEKKMKGKPKNIFVTTENYKNYQESLLIKLEPLSEEDKKFQADLLKRLNEQKEAYAKSKEERRKNKTSHLPPGLENIPPPKLPAIRNWIRYVLSGHHQKELPDAELAEKWLSEVEPDLKRLSDSRIEPKPPTKQTNDKGHTETDMELLTRVIGEMREDLRRGKSKLAIASLNACRELFGKDMLAAVKELKDIDVLERIYFLPD